MDNKLIDNWLEQIYQNFGLVMMFVFTICIVMSMVFLLKTIQTLPTGLDLLGMMVWLMMLMHLKMFPNSVRKSFDMSERRF